MHVTVLASSAAALDALSALAVTLDRAETRRFSSSHAALGHCCTVPPDLVLVGHPLAGEGSARFMRGLRARRETDRTAVVMFGAPEAARRADAFAHGADEYLPLPVAAEVFADRARTAVSRRALSLANGVEAYLAEFECALATRLPRERELFFKLLAMLVGHDGETTSHCLRVGFYARAIADGLALPAAARQMLTLAGPLHDIGKILVAPEVLNKRGRFSPAELAAMRRHPAAGRRLLAGSTLPLLAEAAELAGTHHERWDGRGYPDGLAGTEIPLAGRIVAVADVFDALVSTRSYKREWMAGRAVDLIIAGAGTQFDPDCVRAFCSRWDEILAVREALEAGTAAAERFLAQGLNPPATAT